MRRRLPDVDFAIVFFSGDKSRDERARSCEGRGWKQPVALDEDGALTNIYGIGVCPTTVFARAGGRVAEHGAREPHGGQLRATGAAPLADERSPRSPPAGWSRAGRGVPRLGLVSCPVDARPAQVAA